MTKVTKPVMHNKYGKGVLLPASPTPVVTTTTLPHNPKPGKFLVIEGLDGSGKTVQLQMLVQNLQQMQRDPLVIDLPDYTGTLFGSLAGHYLNGTFGALNEVAPEVAAWLYAGDRLQQRDRIRHALAQGRWVISNRWVSSSEAFLSARVAPGPSRTQFINWLNRVEYEANWLPHPDLTFFLDVPPEYSVKMVAQKDVALRSYTEKTLDLHEESPLNFHNTVRAEYVRMGTGRSNWCWIEVLNPTTGAYYYPHLIQQRILDAIKAHSTW